MTHQTLDLFQNNKFIWGYLISAYQFYFMADFSIPIFDFSGHLGKINAICLADNGNVIYSVEDQSIRIWNIIKKKMIHVLLSINMKTDFLEISNDNLLLAAGDKDGSIEFWDLNTFHRISHIQAFSVSLIEMSFAENENTLITIGESETYLLKKFKLDKHLNLKLADEFDLEEEVRHTIITEKDKSIISLTAKELLFFKFKNLKITQEFDHEGLYIINSSLNRDSILGIEKNGNLKIWEIKKLKLNYELDIPMKEFQNEITHTVLDSVNGRLFYGNQNKLWIWDIEKNTIIKELKAPKSKGKVDLINCIIVDPKEDKLIIGGSEKLRIIDVNTGKNVQTTRRKPVSPPYYDNFTHCHLSDDQKSMVSVRKLVDKSRTKEGVEVWDMKTRKRTHELFPEMDEDANISALTISPDGRFFVTGDDSKVSNGLIWNLKTGKIRKRLKELDYGVNSIVVSYDNSIIITSDNMFDIEMYDSKTGKYLKKISSSTKNVSSLTLTKDNRTLVCAYRDVLDRDFDIIILDVETGEEIKLLSADIEWEEKIIHVEFSSDDKELNARSSSGEWIKWETKSWKITNRIDGSTQRLSERLNKRIYVYPFAENLILNISDEAELTPAIRDFLKSWLDKPKWISESKDVFSLISEISNEKIIELKGEIENLLVAKE
ncbi:MAG: hypothetical protein HeimC2_01260 [Candidatus Heimdallarchaeota archaeon LC_2]|nr:MAG: hypothetical protein HeimC2_01260 [Candidatus Heimdallarchaeota archaeon LC_2]